MRTAVIYARYSSENQTEQSIEGQLRVCTEYAKTHDILILGTYIDRAMTGTNDNRPDFQRMLKDSAKREWDFVLVYKTDRFSRNKFEMAIHKNTLKQNGVKVLSATEFIPQGPEGIILESMLEGYAEYYSAELSQKVKRGMNETRLKGNFTGGRILYGYKVENKKVVIDEDKAEVVRYIYKQYSLGVYVCDIVAELQKRGIYYYGKKWCKNTVYNILKNEKYAGIYRFNGQVFENMYPQIVPYDVFDIVRQKVDANHYGKKSVKAVYLLRNKLRCGYCGRNITAESGTSQNGEVKHYYKCMGRRNNSGCKKQNIRREILEGAVIDTLISALTEKETVDTLVKGLLDMQDRLYQGNSVLSILLKEKRQTETAINNVMSAIEQGIITNTTNKRLRELEQRQEQLEQEILIEKSKATIKITEQQIREFYSEALNLEPQQLIDTLVKQVTVYDDKIDINLNDPLTVSPDRENGWGFSFYTSRLKKDIIDMRMENSPVLVVDINLRI